MTTEELRESLFAAPKNGFARISAEDRAETSKPWNFSSVWMGAVSMAKV